MARHHPRPRDSRDRILASALALFGERGFATSSVGPTKGELYFYFTDKADIARDLHHAPGCA